MIEQLSKIIEGNTPKTPARTQSYIRNNYSWNAVVKKLVNIIDRD